MSVFNTNTKDNYVPPAYVGLWNEIIKELQKAIPVVSFEVFISKLIPMGLKDNKIVLFCETAATKSAILRNYSSHITQAILKCGLTVGFMIIDPSEQPAESAESADGGMYTIPDEGTAPAAPVESGINPKFTFDNFVVGNNEFVHAAAKSVSKSPGNSYNPLFIHGGVGLGKTHILHAIGNYIIRTRPELKVVYVTSERFTNEVVAAIMQGPAGTAALRKKYRSVDVLIIDDIQFLAGKTSTQEEFFHTFNDLQSFSKQIIVSSDREPREIYPLEERLRSRFGSGLIANISTPNLETRIAILKKKSAMQSYNVPDDVLHFIAEHQSANIRELEEALARVHFHSKLYETELTVDAAAEILKGGQADSNEAITIDVIINVVCKYYKVTKDDLLGKKKNKEIVYPRQMCIYLVTEILAVPLKTIGLIFGRDHTTIMHSRDKIAGDMDDDKIKRAFTDIRNMIYKK